MTSGELLLGGLVRIGVPPLVGASLVGRHWGVELHLGVACCTWGLLAALGVCLLHWGVLLDGVFLDGVLLVS